MTSRYYYAIANIEDTNITATSNIIYLPSSITSGTTEIFNASTREIKVSWITNGNMSSLIQLYNMNNSGDISLVDSYTTPYGPSGNRIFVLPSDLVFGDQYYSIINAISPNLGAITTPFVSVGNYFKNAGISRLVSPNRLLATWQTTGFANGNLQFYYKTTIDGTYITLGSSITISIGTLAYNYSLTSLPPTGTTYYYKFTISRTNSILTSSDLAITG